MNLSLTSTRCGLNANLVTLSGCATGMNFVAAGDELLGLQRGLFYGASTLLLSFMGRPRSKHISTDAILL